MIEISNLAIRLELLVGEVDPVVQEDLLHSLATSNAAQLIVETLGEQYCVLLRSYLPS
jgi:hypothetical protein